MNMSLLLMKRSKTNPSRIARNSASLPSMSVIGSAQPDVIKVKVYKSAKMNSSKSAENSSSKKFCIDPRLANFRTMQYLIAQAFDIRSDFTISAVQKSSLTGQEKSTVIWSDWDLDEAIKLVTPDSYLRLRFELTNCDEELEDWDFIPSNDCASNIRWLNVDNRSIIATVKQNPNNKTSSTLNRAINWMYGGHERRTAKPINENDFKKYFDQQGRLIYANELRQAIYEGGVEPTMRRIIWRHLLNIYPAHSTSQEQIEYLEEVKINYEKLKNRWQHEQDESEEIQRLIRSLQKDVLRADRICDFYGTSCETNSNLQSLLHILTTYSINHPSVTYCQGMTEYASTLLYVLRDEAVAYLSFCAIMKRIRVNFATDGVAIATKFHHLKVLLQAIDPVYWTFLETCDSVNLFFTYRWLLLECKREFPFHDALRVLEVMWATLPIDNEPPVLSELPTLPNRTSGRFERIPRSAFLRRHIRRTSSCPNLSSPISTSLSNKSSQSNKHRQYSLSVHYPIHAESDIDVRIEENSSPEPEEYSYDFVETKTYHSSSTSTKSRDKSLDNSFSLSEITDLISSQVSIPSSIENSSTPTTQAWLQRLPTNDTIGLEEENSFLLFLCIAILLAHRDYLIKQKNFDDQDIAIHFDRYRRRHRAERLLHCARTLYGQYIQWARKKRMLEDLASISTS